MSFTEKLLSSLQRVITPPPMPEIDLNDPQKSLQEIRCIKFKQNNSDPFGSDNVIEMTINRGSGTTLFLGIVFSLMGYGFFFAYLYGIYGGWMETHQLELDSFLPLIFIIIFPITGTILTIFAFSKGHVKFYPDRIESYFGIRKKENNTFIFYRDGRHDVTKVYSGSENKVSIYKVCIDNRVVARGLYDRQAEILRRFLEAYLRHPI